MILRNIGIAWGNYRADERARKTLRKSKGAHKAMPTLGMERVLSVEKAEKIAREFSGFSLKKMFEVAAYVMSPTYQTEMVLL